ncbi:UDP-N-acetylmuramoyl-tripeptide--D-alanyl-D-alanine ligase [Neisseria sp. oral taxon 020 str. F0370]|uniref:UDP-N-acetylmuramoyl-tripeptide--D-alanyl-D- alanine ligase n=1 Tax=unclassified Neisseria TaxID=2623750 RepID=UPI0002A2BB4B|nr:MULTISPECIES: UDP-N-acetylmuramoyl-tripeptide--D-alanyl-D-alanine ligase [unclassified Neisseria]ASP18031.1 UDP-N-acetylmuramoyl-tripeptide--D-alanyl-D-alanine ligase [Neisseria sp. KEM232]EKY02503.1 UDP-N-acetylmuramoyl-tripeptide--D-alanyl-D-alanine ligase [Neisseria sp. oral taxon 020 str. F0370]
MKPLDLNFICQALNLPLPSENRAVSRIVTDSRDIREGDVFFALEGERFDGHDFAADVSAAGAAAAVVSRGDCAGLRGALLVGDTLAALQTLAHAWRKNVNPFVFGITGSGGKTTVKEMLAAVLRRRFGEEAVLATAGNFNNHIGLPLTLLKLNENHRYAVIEMGMNHFGELAVLTQIAQPDAALVNNALRAHVGCGFDGTADIARAKSEIYQGLGADGLALIPCEDANASVFQTASAAHKQQTFGVDKGGVHAQNIVLKPLSCAFDLVCGNDRAAVSLPVPGRHNVHNAAAAAALALAAGLSLQEVADGLKDFSNIKGRLKVKRGIKGATLIDDTYNANPDSMKAAIDVLAALPAPRVFVMGDMGELGEDEAAAMHAEVGAYARDKDIEAAYFVGDESVEAAETFGAAGLWFAAKDPLIQVLEYNLPEGASVLVKGSRFMEMEEVVGALEEKEAV